MLTRYREIDVSGGPREMGRQIGEAARDEIRGFVAIALERVNKTMRVSRARAMEVAERSLEFADRYSRDMTDEIRGMAEAAGCSVADLMLLQVRNQLKPDTDAGCTSLSLAGRGGSIVAQNWDNDPALDPFTIVLTRRPTGKPATMNITQAGLIAYIGFNDAGIGLCLNTLPAPSRELGVPHYFTVRGIYESRSLDGAVEAVRRAERAIPANIILATPQGPADLEVTVDAVHVLTDGGDGGPVAVKNPDYTEFTDKDGKPLPFHSGLYKMPDGTVTTRHSILGVCEAKNGNVYALALLPYTLLEIPADQLK